MADIGWRKRRPRGWTPATAFARHHRTYDPHRGVDGEGGETVIDPADYQLLMDVEWEVHVPGRAPFPLREDGRRCPLWCDASSFLWGKGRRFWSVRLRETHGLLADVAVPCLVPPDRSDRIWVDWDEAYSAHLPAWDRMSAVERAVAERKGGIDAVAERVLSPFRPRLAAGDEHLVDEALAAEEARDARARAEGELVIRAMNMGFRPPKAAEHQALLAHVRWVLHLHEVGREVPATVASIAPTGRQLCRTPVYELHLDVADAGPDGAGSGRRVVHHEVMNDAFAARMAAGTATTVFVDPADPGRIALDRPTTDGGPRPTGGGAGIEGYLARHERITATGREATAMIVSAGPTGGTLHGLPEWAVELDVTDGVEVRRVVHHEPMGRPTAPWTPGTRTKVRIDPDDPDALTFA